MQCLFSLRLSLAFLSLGLSCLGSALRALGGVDHGSRLHTRLLARDFNVVRVLAIGCSRDGVLMATSDADVPGGVNEAHG